MLEFPVKSPKGSVLRKDVKALEQLKHWKKVKIRYAEHTVSTTIYVGEDEWVEVANWLWKNWNIIGGLSFLPREDEEHTYKLAPYEEITEKKYTNMIRDWPEISFDLLTKYEKEDETNGGGNGCETNVCEIEIPPIVKK